MLWDWGVFIKHHVDIGIETLNQTSTVLSNWMQVFLCEHLFGVVCFDPTEWQECSGEHMADAEDTVCHQPRIRWGVWHHITGPRPWLQESTFLLFLCILQGVRQTTSSLLWRWCPSTPACPSTSEPLRQTACCLKAAKGMKTFDYFIMNVGPQLTVIFIFFIYLLILLSKKCYSQGRTTPSVTYIQYWLSIWLMGKEH